MAFKVRDGRSVQVRFVFNSNHTNLMLLSSSNLARAKRSSNCLRKSSALILDCCVVVWQGGIVRTSCVSVSFIFDFLLMLCRDGTSNIFRKWMLSVGKRRFKCKMSSTYRNFELWANWKVNQLFSLWKAFFNLWNTFLICTDYILKHHIWRQCVEAYPYQEQYAVCTYLCASWLLCHNFAVYLFPIKETWLWWKLITRMPH